MNIFSPTENRNTLHEKERGSPLACAAEMFSNLHISTSIKLCWNPGSGCGFIRGHGSSGKTAPFSAAYLSRWRHSRNHEKLNITETEPQNRFMISFNAALFTFSFWTRLSCTETRQKKIMFSLFSASPLWPGLKGKKKPSQLEWTAVASSVCGFYLIDCWVKEKAEWDHVLQHLVLEIYTYREVRQLM